MTVFTHTCAFLYLLDFCGRTLEQLDVSCTDALSVFRQRFVRIVLVGKQHERIARGSPIGLVDKQ